MCRYELLPFALPSACMCSVLGIDLNTMVVSFLKHILKLLAVYNVHTIEPMK